VGIGPHGTASRRGLLTYVCCTACRLLLACGSQDKFRANVTRFLNATWVQLEHPGGSAPPLHRPEGTLPRLLSASVYDWSSLNASAVGFDPMQLLE